MTKQPSELKIAAIERVLKISKSAYFKHTSDRDYTHFWIENGDRRIAYVVGPTGFSTVQFYVAGEHIRTDELTFDDIKKIEDAYFESIGIEAVEMPKETSASRGFLILFLIILSALGMYQLLEILATLFVG